LQGDLERADKAAQRFAGGLATLMLGNTLPDEDPVYEDAGQTLGVWGVEAGPYVMLPLLGPSNFRDTTGTVIDWFVDPFGLFGTTKLAIARGSSRAVIDRSKNVDAVRDLQRNSLDYYAAVRSLYRQRRNAGIENGAPTGQGPAPTIGLDPDVDGSPSISANTPK
ncbi:MAG: MlaA family lipoprotein, partial [Alphaproteobacteria bacterium]